MPLPLDWITPHRHAEHLDDPAECPGSFRPVPDEDCYLVQTAGGDLTERATCPVCGRCCELDSPILPADWPEET